MFDVTLNFLLLVSTATKTTCAKSEFTCTDGTCLNIELTCNGAKECLDGSDENTTFCGKWSTTPHTQSQGDPVLRDHPINHKDIIFSR